MCHTLSEHRRKFLRKKTLWTTMSLLNECKVPSGGFLYMVKFSPTFLEFLKKVQSSCSFQLIVIIFCYLSPRTEHEENPGTPQCKATARDRFEYSGQLVHEIVIKDHTLAQLST